MSSLKTKVSNFFKNIFAWGYMGLIITVIPSFIFSFYYLVFYNPKVDKIKNEYCMSFNKIDFYEKNRGEDTCFINSKRQDGQVIYEKIDHRKLEIFAVNKGYNYSKVREDGMDFAFYLSIAIIIIVFVGAGF